jgi:hypothetical protein
MPDVAKNVWSIGSVTIAEQIHSGWGKMLAEGLTHDSF